MPPTPRARRSILYKCNRYKQQLCLAFADKRKAYDSIPRDALRRVLLSGPLIMWSLR
jgi:hypothetical protein